MIATDDRRYVAYLNPEGTPEVWDTWTDAIRTIKWVKLGRTGGIGFNCYETMSIRVGKPWVTWSHGSRLKAFNHRTGQRFNRQFEPDGVRIAPVRAGVAVAEPTGDQDGRHRYRIKLIRRG